MISIITITYNNFNQLHRTLASVTDSEIYRSQKVPIEIIVINGGNELQSKEYLDKWLREHPKDIVIQEKDKGISDAFNKGVHCARYPIIQFLNSGDILFDEEFYLKAIMLFKSDENLKYVHGDIIFDDENAFGLKMVPRQNFKCLGLGMPMHHQSMLVKKELFHKIGEFKLQFKMAMDYEWILRLVKAGYIGLYIPKVAVRMDGAGISIQREWDSIKECFIALKENQLLNILNILGISFRALRRWIRNILYSFIGAKNIAYLKKGHNNL